MEIVTRTEADLMYGMLTQRLHLRTDDPDAEVAKSLRDKVWPATTACQETAAAARLIGAPERTAIRTTLSVCPICGSAAAEISDGTLLGCPDCGYDAPDPVGEPVVSEVRLAQALYKADEAFWKAIVDEFPTEHGDFPPDADRAWHQASESAVKTWLRWNYEGGERL